MVSLWIVAGLILSAIAISVLGALFSILGLAALFSGAVIAVAAMATSMEFSKFVLAAYLHRRWGKLGFLFKYYLAASVVILSLITSLGIFGFLSEAYQSASSVLEGATIQMASLKTQKENFVNEINRLNNSINEIPANRITRRIQARKEFEPVIADLTKKSQALDLQMTEADLQILEIKKKVGPLIYISKSFKMDIDLVVKYLILIFVLVFDPLAICLVIASSEAMLSRRGPQAESAPSVFSAAKSNLTAANPEQVVQMRFSDDDDAEEKDDSRQGS
jgi:hypothetical protein